MLHHAFRFTVHDTYGCIWPARHLTGGNNDSLGTTPPIGARFRLKAGFDISGFSPGLQVILRTMKKYGMIIADNGSDWYLSGAPDEHWDNDLLHGLDVLKGDNSVAVETTCTIANPAAPGQADLSGCP